MRSQTGPGSRAAWRPRPSAIAAAARRGLIAAWIAGARAAGASGAGHVVELERFHGRIGNNLAQLGHILLFANRSGAGRIHLAPAKEQDIPTRAERQNREQLLSIFDLPDDLYLEGRGPDSDIVVPETCESSRRLLREGGKYVDPWYRTPCSNASAREYRELLHRYLRPLLSSKLSACVSRGDAGAARTLTVHLRSDDVWPSSGRLAATPRIWTMPPCAMFEKVVRDGGFERVVVVTSPDRRNPCVAWFEAFSARSGVAVELQSGSVLEDACALLRAEHLMLSYSSFGHNLALLSDRLRRIYTRGVFDPHWLLGCDVGPDIGLLKFDIAVGPGNTGPYDDSVEGAVDFVRSYPLDGVLGPTPCLSAACVSAQPHGPLVCDAGGAPDDEL